MFRRSVFAMVTTVVLLFVSFARQPSVEASFAAPVMFVKCGATLLHRDNQVSLILRLADRDFLARQQAAQHLAEQGVDAWDILVVASASTNHEIASASRRLIREIDIQPRLKHPSGLLSGYREMTYADRARVMIRLGRSFQLEERILLAELVRFEEDDFLSCSAAVELITGGWHSQSACVDVVRRNHRIGSRWLRLDTRSRIDGILVWRSTIDGFFASKNEAIRRDQRCLTLWYAEQCLNIGDATEANRVASQLITRLPAESEIYVEVMDWCLLHRLHEVASGLLQHSTREFDEIDTNMCWRAAELNQRLGKRAESVQHSGVAIEKCKEAPLELFQHAMILQSVGLERMAERGLAALIDSQSSDDMTRLQACQMLAELRYQSNDLEGAIQAIAQLSDVVDDARPFTPKSPVDATCIDLLSRKSFFEYLLAVKQGDWQSAKSLIELCMNKSSVSTEWLIALGNVPNEVVALTDWPEQLDNSVQSLIENALDSRKQRIEALRGQFDRDPKRDRVRQVELATELNSYAWLSSQTTARLDESEAAAREANQLHPGSGKMLDTLAACLHHQGKWTEAIAIQRRALIRSPYSVSMKRNLSQYQRAWAMAQLPKANVFR